MTAKKRNKVGFGIIILLFIIGLHQVGSVHQFFQDGYIMNTMLDHFFWCILISSFVATVTWFYKKGQAQTKMFIVFSFLLVFLSLMIPEHIVRWVGYDRSYLEENGEWGYTSPSVFSSPTWTVKCEANDKGRYRKTEYDQTWASNSLGYVDREWDKGATGLKIMALGDSFTEGLGGDVPWIEALSKMLEGQCSAENYYFNAGISGHDPLLALQNLRADLLGYRPDVVMLAVNSSDLDDIVARGCFDRFIVTDDGDSIIMNTKHRKLEYLYAVSHVARAVLRAMGLDWTLLDNDLKLHEYNAAKVCLAEAIEQYQFLADREGFKFCVVFHPSIHNVERNDMSEFDVTKGVLEEQNINYIDLLGYYHDSLQMGQTNIYNYFWPQDRHQKDYTIFAKAVLNDLGCAYFSDTEVTMSEEE